MGDYDSIWAHCPKCGCKVEFQSKSGPCNMHDHDLWSVPTDVLLGALDATEMCPVCNAEFQLKLPPMATTVLIER